MKLTPAAIVKAFKAQFPHYKIDKTLEDGVIFKIDEPYSKPRDKAPGDSDAEEREVERRTPIDVGRVVQEWRKMLSALEPDQAAELREAMLAELSDEEDDDGKSLRHLKKSKPKGIFTSLVEDAAWNDPNGFTNSFRREPVVKIFSDERIDKATQEDDLWGGSMASRASRPAPRTGPKIVHIGKD